MSLLLRNPVSRNQNWPDVRIFGQTRILVLSRLVLAEHWSAGMHQPRVVVQLAWSGEDANALEHALAAVFVQLPRTRWQRIALYFADAHVHMLRMPALSEDWRTIDLTGQTQQAYARALLVQTYGEEARHWPFRVQDICPPQDSLLVTIPLLQTFNLNAFFKPRAIQWQVQPLACALWANTRLPANGTVLSAESQLIRLLHLNAGKITHVAAFIVGIEEVETIAHWVLRERTLLDVASSDCYWLTEPNTPKMQRIAQGLKSVLSGLKLQHLQSVRPVTHLYQELSHVVTP